MVYLIRGLSLSFNEILKKMLRFLVMSVPKNKKTKTDKQTKKTKYIKDTFNGKIAGTIITVGKSVIPALGERNTCTFAASQRCAW